MAGKKHRLLIYERVYRQRRGLFLLAAFVLALLFLIIAQGWPVALPDEFMQSLWPPEYDILLLIASGIFFLAFLFKLVAPRVAYVQCTERNIRIQTPLYPLILSYKRVITVRPNQWGKLYPPERMKRGQHRLLDKALGEGVLVLDLKGWPVSPKFLKLWIPGVMFSPTGDGLVLWVKDWMLLNRELSDYKDRWREARTRPKPVASGYQRVKR
jgi:hypothetical protein